MSACGSRRRIELTRENHDWSSAIAVKRRTQEQHNARIRPAFAVFPASRACVSEFYPAALFISTYQFIYPLCLALPESSAPSPSSLFHHLIEYFAPSRGKGSDWKINDRITEKERGRKSGRYTRPVPLAYSSHRSSWRSARSNDPASLLKMFKSLSIFSPLSLSLLPPSPFRPFLIDIAVGECISMYMYI